MSQEIDSSLQGRQLEWSDFEYSSKMEQFFEMIKSETSFVTLIHL